MRKFLFLLFSLTFFFAPAQSPKKLNSAEIHQAIKKLNFLGSVLYVAAHPDDENTRLISYFSNAVHARTAYLSITRGDGGQNLIGPELKEQLGLIRTQELLAARNIDGGEQLFTRAIDFGYTKTPQEAMEFWNSNEVLGDVVWAIRKFRPDVIINRFNHRTAGETHGQHTASALLAMDAFDLAGDPSTFKDQLEYTTPHQPKKLYFNTSPWFYGSEEAFEEALDSTFLEFETGVYFPLLGLSNPEIAALSRSQHQSQGFGSTGSRGTQKEYLEMIKGDLPAGETSVFEGIDTSWNRVKGGTEIGKILEAVEKEYNFEDPAASLPQLIKAYSLIQGLEDQYWRALKLEQIKEVIAASAGLFLEATAQNPGAVPSEEIELNFEAINRSSGEMRLTNISLQPGDREMQVNALLANNESWKDTFSLPIPADIDYTSPYWLKEKSGPGKYRVKDQTLIGLPETPPSITATFLIEISGTAIPFTKEIVYKFNDAVDGEVYQPFEIVPPVSVKIRDGVMVFADTASKIVPVTVYAGKSNVKGVLSLQAGKGWKIEPASSQIAIPQKGDAYTVNFKVTPLPARAKHSWNLYWIITEKIIPMSWYTSHIVIYQSKSW
ncbi:PIG-L family deacetylase [Antarcticibacterium flavum]|uniref:PIG-L family deacetylase n=1 Tax=Antarcticibacterium flavum TaxID=2058175 RepID=UPI0026962F76|nr:PIG-L family deacetylase [Antarcticibacterium flavum]